MFISNYDRKHISKYAPLFEFQWITKYIYVMKELFNSWGKNQEKKD